MRARKKSGWSVFTELELISNLTTNIGIPEPEWEWAEYTLIFGQHLSRPHQIQNGQSY